MNDPAHTADLLFSARAVATVPMTSQVSHSENDIDAFDSRTDRRYLREVGVQISALLHVKLLLALRNRALTAMRLLTPLIFTVLIFVVNIGLESRYSSDPIYLDLKSPADSEIGPIPDCHSAECVVFAYIPAMIDNFIPSEDFNTVSDFAASFSNSTSCSYASSDVSMCLNSTCNGGEAAMCASLCEAWRVHRVVRGMMRNNQDAPGPPIPAVRTLGFCNLTGLDRYVLAHPDAVQGGLVFSSTGDNQTTFAIVTNSTPYMVPPRPSPVHRPRDHSAHTFARSPPLRPRALSAERARPPGPGRWRRRCGEYTRGRCWRWPCRCRWRQRGSWRGSSSSGTRASRCAWRRGPSRTRRWRRCGPSRAWSPRSSCSAASCSPSSFRQLSLRLIPLCNGYGGRGEERAGA